jgi:uncharacterized protein YukE
MSNLTGYNPEEVTMSINAIKGAYEELVSILGDRIQTEIVNGMSDKWACSNAQKFFNEAFKPAVDGLLAGVNTTFESVVNAMNEAAQIWASDCGEVYSPVSLSLIIKNMDTSNIFENISGIRGIDLDQASQVAAKLPTIAAEAESAVAKASSAVDSCGFMGGSQAANLKASLDIIKTNISNATNEITGETKAAFESTIATYGNAAGQISQAFAGN